MWVHGPHVLSTVGKYILDNTHSYGCYMCVTTSPSHSFKSLFRHGIYVWVHGPHILSAVGKRVFLSTVGKYILDNTHSYGCYMCETTSPSHSFKSLFRHGIYVWVHGPHILSAVGKYSFIAIDIFWVDSYHTYIDFKFLYFT